ncbi:DEAD/DEAH box helicase [Photobacterium sp. ZSDE20]|uniref:DEAD/DEAH box helicase n=1 Tax=Photobacterium pectinilyticum TaxID=2906793 RepID=A0ABT1N6U4_9GAMM|nr:DEAD/DEAH box helicase [Photobacterium sp. ZSDE20]MCQ1060471.1 DEAD/DEAH box helicase [Photobacterium sp. ZSDE20]MDD1826221.1 DEAD/DEAH box helicase [Photobacterium sp. ZSDE20]
MAIEFTIKRHAVDASFNGLSCFQHQLLTLSEFIRVACAPAGCGKSYAFLRAVLDRDRVLFVVPTKRLANNLIASLHNDIREHKKDCPAEAVDKKIALWSSDGTALLKGAGVTNVTQVRLNQISSLSTLEGGEIVVTTPESLAWLILNPDRFPVKHVSDRSILDLIFDFNHVVFDEYHTIEPRGMSLSMIISWLCVHIPSSQVKLTYLSATPIDLSRAYSEFGFDQDALTYLSERVEDVSSIEPLDGRRVIHGDVKVQLHEGLPLSSLLINYKSQVINEVEDGRQVVLIFDRLYSNGLSHTLPELRNSLLYIGVAPEQVLLISSVDDGQKGSDSYLGFAVGADKNPADYAMLIATSSIEVGVTFNTRLIFMEPGHNSTSVIQRIGRASRGDFKGNVHITYTREDQARHVWLKRLLYWAHKHNGDMVSIGEVIAVVTDAVSSSSPNATPVNINKESVHGEMSTKAAAIAGLAWRALLQHSSIKNARAKILLKHTPRKARQMESLLFPVRSLCSDDLYGAHAKKWLKGFENEVQELRTIKSTITIINANGTHWNMPWWAVEQSTDLLTRYIPTKSPKGEWQLHIDETHWREALTELDAKYQEVSLVLPHSRHLIVSPRRTAMKTFIKILKQEIKGGLLPLHVEGALEAVIDLTQKTGLLIEHEI